jgi:hypothetical protein
MAKGNLSDLSVLCAKSIMKMIESHVLIIPGQVSMQYLAAEVDTTPQNIGMAMEGIVRILEKNGLVARAAGTPRVIQVSVAG